MAKLSRIVNPGSEQDSLPIFMVWSSQDVGYDIYDSYLGHVTSGFPYTNSELWGQYSGYTQTNSTISSNSTSYFVQSISCNTSDGNVTLSVPSKGGRQVSMNRNPDQFPGWWSRNAVIVHEEGIRNPWSLHFNNNYWAVTIRGGALGWDSVDANSSLIRDVGAYSATYGSASYNQRTRTLCVIMASDGNNNYRAYFYKHPTIDLMSKSLKGGEFYKFLTEAKAGTNGASYFYNDFTWQTSGSTSYNESRYKVKTVMGDNGLVGLMRMTPSNQTVSGFFTPGANGATVSVTNLIALGLTTSYGYEQGDRYGAQHQTTWDSSWVACYTPYYYYGSGMNVHFICAKDPSKQYYRQDGNTSLGFQIVPVLENQFLVAVSINNDGNAEMQFASLDPEGHRVNGLDGGGGAIANGAQVHMEWQYQQLDTPYTSTNYSAIVAAGNWFGGSR